LKLFITIFFWTLISLIHAQNNFVLNKLSELQVNQSDELYCNGLFKSQRITNSGKKTFEDNNIFFTGLITNTLKSIQDSLPETDRTIIKTICSRSISTFKNYKNRNGDITYNFYQIRPEENPFPNATFLRNYKGRQLADDFDDTSILYLAQNSSDSLNYAIKNKMAKHSTTSLYTSTFKEYRKEKVYKTWFAKKQNQDIDLCVLSNALLFVFDKKLALSAIDTSSIQLIQSAINKELHINKAHLISAHYQSTPIILYHIARLISAANHPLLDELRPKIIHDINTQLNEVNDEVEKMILLSSLFRLNHPIDFEINLQNLENNMTDFFWFKANPLCGSRFWIKKMAGSTHFMQTNYRCKAYYWALLLELEVLSKASYLKTDATYTTIYHKS
jgi:hypothetical protein